MYIIIWICISLSWIKLACIIRSERQLMADCKPRGYLPGGGGGGGCEGGGGGGGGGRTGQLI